MSDRMTATEIRGGEKEFYANKPNPFDALANKILDRAILTLQGRSGGVSEAAKTDLDIALYGSGVMVDGKHVPLKDFNFNDMDKRFTKECENLYGED